jgi:ABC-type multidrug transport system ATPase subunit
MKENSILKFSNISKNFQQKKVLDNISLEIYSGDLFGFIGLNGIGKTTLIKIALDLLSQDEGAVEIFNINNILPESRNRLCYLPEKFSPPSNLTGSEFIKFATSFYNHQYSAFTLKEICDNLEFNFDDLKKTTNQYSKGMGQKLGLIATFLSNSDLIILDEPMSGLDPKARIALKKQMIEYNKQGKTIFFSSHILVDIDEICNRIAIIHNQKITYCGNVPDFKNKYQSTSLDNAFLKEIGVF